MNIEKNISKNNNGNNKVKKNYRAKLNDHGTVKQKYSNG